MIHKTDSNRPIAVDLFAGAGGMTLGFEQAGFDVLAAVDIDPIHCATHHFNFPFWSVLCKSIIDTTGEEIRGLSSINNREIDVVFGGPPCQGFSLMGKRLVDDTRNSLVFHFLRLVVELKPKFFVMENVPGMATGASKTILLKLIDNFKAQGYKVEENYQVLNAVYYGVPQKRERLFILGCRECLQLPSYPLPTTKPPHVPSPTVWDALIDLPEVEDYPELYQRDWVIADFHQPSPYSKQLRELTETANNFSYPRHYNPRHLTSSLLTKHTLKTIQRFESTPPGKTEPISRFHRLDPHGVCNTLRAGTASDRGAFTSPRPIHPFVPRCITVREAARLHSYPDWFRFHVTKWHGFRQVGNSVPPFLAKAAALEIIKVLKIIPSKPREKKALGDEYLLKLDPTQAAHYFGVDPHPK